MMATRKNIFATPAIVKLINVYLEMRDNASLALSNRLLFQTIMPLLWERVNDLDQLFELLSDSENTQKTQRRDEMERKALTENDFARFNVYAPWIKHIEVSKRTYPPILDALCRYSVARTLLPSLTTITSTNPNGWASVTSVLPFISPSLSSLEFVIANQIFHPTISVPEVSVLLHLLSEKCPELRTLSILPQNKSRSKLDNAPEKSLLDFIPEDSLTKAKDNLACGLPPFIAALPPLTSLTCSSEFLDHKCFTTISAWPPLESLVISLDSYKKDYTFPKLSDEAFPSLVHLGLYWLPSSSAFRRFWNTPALVGKLTSVNLMASGNMCSEKNNFSQVLLPILGALVKKSPNLQHFWFRAIDSDAMRAWYNVSMTTLDVLRDLPLRTLWIEGVEFMEPPMSHVKNLSGSVFYKAENESMGRLQEGHGPEDVGDEQIVETKDGAEGQVKPSNMDGDGDEEGNQIANDGAYDEDHGSDEKEERLNRCTNVAERLSTMFPDLIELGLLRNSVDFAEIPIFYSRMPHLEALRFDFELGSVSRLKPDISSVPRCRHASMFTLEANFFGLDEMTCVGAISDFNHHKAISLSEYLFSFWPNVQIVALSDEQEPEGYLEQKKMMTLINEHLAALACCNRDPSIKYEDVKTLNQTSWKRCSK